MKERWRALRVLVVVMVPGHGFLSMLKSKDYLECEWQNASSRLESFSLVQNQEGKWLLEYQMAANQPLESVPTAQARFWQAKRALMLCPLTLLRDILT